MARSSKLECLADPGTLVLARLQTPRLHQSIGVLVPAAVWKIVTQHRGRSLRLVYDAQRHVGLGEPHERFLDMTRPLISRHHDLEPVDRAGEFASLQVPASDLHLLARKLVARHLDLSFGGDSILGARIPAHYLVQAFERFFRAGLIA